MYLSEFLQSHKWPISILVCQIVSELTFYPFFIYKVFLNIELLVSVTSLGLPALRGKRRWPGPRIQTRQPRID